MYLKQREKWASIFNYRRDQKVQSISYRKSNRVEPLIFAYGKKDRERMSKKGRVGKKSERIF